MSKQKQTEEQVENVNEEATQAEAENNETETEQTVEEKLLAQVEQLKEDFLRAKAETENLRRRSQDEVAKAIKFGAEKFATGLLTVKDSLDAALNTTEQSAESWQKGVELTSKQVDDVFAKMTIEEVNPQDEKFDPNLHQAVASEWDENKEEGIVLKVFQKGYKWHDRVLRAAMVVVNRKA